MFRPEESALLLDLNAAAVQRLRQLHMQQTQALRRGDEACADRLQPEINELNEDCDKVLDCRRG